MPGIGKGRVLCNRPGPGGIGRGDMTQLLVLGFGQIREVDHVHGRVLMRGGQCGLRALAVTSARCLPGTPRIVRGADW